MTMSWRSDGVDDSTTTAASYGLIPTGPIMRGKLDGSHDRLPPQACESTTASSSSAASSPLGGDDDTTTISDHAATMVSAAAAAASTSSERTMMMRDQPASSSAEDDPHGQQQDDPSRSSVGRSSPKNMLIGGSGSLTAADSGGDDTDADPPYKSSLLSPRGQRFADGGGGSGEGNHSEDGNDDGYDDDDDDDDDDEADQTLSQRPQEQLQQEQQALNGSSGTGRMAQTSSKARQDGNGNVVPEDDTEGVDQEIPWKPQDTQSVCEFTHTITEYSSKRDSGCKKAEYSATTVDNLGNKWRLIVYVNGNGRASNHHLSLFLQVGAVQRVSFSHSLAAMYSSLRIYRACRIMVHVVVPSHRRSPTQTTYRLGGKRECRMF